MSKIELPFNVGWEVTSNSALGFKSFAKLPPHTNKVPHNLLWFCQKSTYERLSLSDGIYEEKGDQFGSALRKHWRFSNRLTQLDSKNRSRRSCETLINVSSWPCAKNKSVNHKLSKGELLVQRSRLTGCQDFYVLGTKTSQSFCNNLFGAGTGDSPSLGESVKRFQRSWVARRVIIWTSVSIIERQNKVAFRGKC